MLRVFLRLGLKLCGLEPCNKGGSLAAFVQGIATMVHVGLNRPG